MAGSTLSIGILHYPVYNKNKEVVITSITTSSLHDISRTAKTYGIDNVYIITPLKAQQELVRRLIAHWQIGYGAEYNPTRKEALQDLIIVNNFGECLQDVTQKYGQRPVRIVTSANIQKKKNIAYQELYQRIKTTSQPHLIIFGTGWGIEKNLIESMDLAIKPIYGQGQGDYNHLSVRAAVAIILDRIYHQNK